MAHLTTNDGEGKTHELTRDVYVLGRHPECDIIVDAGAVSRHHAKITKDGDRFFVEDMESRNGTFVNGRMVFGRYGLSDGDQIRVCDISFTYHEVHPDENSSRNFTVLLDDSMASSVSTVMSSLDVSSEDSHTVRLSSSTEAKLQAILEITRSLGKSLSLDQVLPKVLDSLFKIFLQADRGFIVLQDEHGHLVPRWTKLRRESDETIRISKTIVNQVIDSKQAILSADAASDERFDMSQSIADFRIRSMICAPLIDADGNVLGIIQVDTKDQRKRFRQEDLDVLGSVAIQAAVAIDNSQMHENMIRQRELERDLNLAREVQKGFLPHRVPNVDGYEFFDFYEPANHVGGDYYDYVNLPDGRLAIVVADVVGHGIAAALMMSKLSASVRHALHSNMAPKDCVERLNEGLIEGEFDGRFITLILAVLDPRENRISMVSAGHSYPVIKKNSGEMIHLDQDAIGFPLMVEEKAEYQEVVLSVDPKDVLILFTDGLNEAMNESGDQYGMERIEANLITGEAQKSGSQIVRDVDDFVDGRPKKDDMCIVCVGRN